MIDRTAELSVSRQAILLGISRGSIYYQNRPVSDADLKLMHRIDKLHMEFPFAGSRMLQGLLVQEGFSAGRLHVATLMKRMGIEALYRKPNTSKPAAGHKIYPYLLRKLPISRPNQVWAMDITYIPMARGFIYLAAVLDWSPAACCPGGCRSRWRPTSALKLSKRRWRTTASRKSSTRIRAASSRRPSSSRCWRAGKSRSAWTEKGLGGITSSSSGSGGPSNTRRSTCGPMPACPRPAPRSGATSASTIPAAHVHRLTAKPQIRLTSTRCCRFRWQHNQGGNPLKKRPEPVQINRTTSDSNSLKRIVDECELSVNDVLRWLNSPFGIAKSAITQTIRQAVSWHGGAKNSEDKYGGMRKTS